MNWITIVAIIFIPLFIFVFYKIKKAGRDLEKIKINLLKNKPTIILDERLKDIVKTEKKILGNDEVIIKNQYSVDIMIVKKSKWKEMQTRMDASFWDRLDDKI